MVMKFAAKYEKNSQVPIIGLTALSKISDRLKGFNLGVDDYVIKPFSPKELEVRIKSILWRSNPNNQKLLKKNYKTFQIGGLTFNLTNKLVSKNNLKIRLTDLEFNLFELLVENAGKELSRVTILDNVWGYIPSRYIDTRIVDVQISRLRAKIEENPSNPELIITVRGIGYMFRGHKDTKAVEY
jgi:OmpR family response regulator RpaB